jgi:hypothetical protein
VAGDQICERLAAACGGRWEAAIEAWRRRDEADQVGLLAWSAGMDRALARALIEEGTLTAPRDFNDAANDDDELRIAARMAGALPAYQIQQVVSLARQFEKRDTDQLDGLAEACSAYLATHCAGDAPFIQGESAARFVREQLGIAEDRKVEIFTVAADLGVAVRHAQAEPTTLDGLAIWGGRHGPGVFLNESSRRILHRRGPRGDVKTSEGARVTLAHELCHLLLDGGHALSAIEVLKARMPASVEPRAKSFAGEFLLPSRAAAAAWFEAGRPLGRADVEAVVVDLTKRFGVTRSVAAWKLQHGAAVHDVDLAAILDSIAPRR